MSMLQLGWLFFIFQETIDLKKKITLLIHREHLSKAVSKSNTII